MKIKKLLLVTFSLIFFSCTRKKLPEVSISNSENLVAGQETDVQNELIEHDDEIIMEEYYDLLQSETELSDKFNVPLVRISIREIEPFVGEGTTLEILQNLKKENLYRIYIYSSLGQTVYTCIKDDEINNWYLEKKSIFYQEPFNQEYSEESKAYFRFNGNCEKQVEKKLIKAEINTEPAVIDFKTAESLIDFINKNTNS